MRMRVNDICNATGAELVFGSGELECSSCVIDSRACEKGSLFIAFPGEKVDGNDYTVAAIESGASCVCMTREPRAEELAVAQEQTSVLIQVGDATEFLLSLSSYVRSLHDEWLIVGVTGSVGKTTTREMIAAALSSSYRVHTTAANFNSLLGSSLTLLAAPEDAQILVVEMGMDVAGEISRQVRAIRPHIAVITNVGVSHLERLGTRDAIAYAKAEILEGLVDAHMFGILGHHLLMCSHDDYASLIAGDLAPKADAETHLVGSRTSDFVYSSSVVLGDDGCATLNVCYADGESYPAHLSVPSTHVVDDALLAAAVADIVGVPRADALSAIEATRPFKMRLEARTAPGRPRVIDDSYNASPASMEAAIDALCAMECTGMRYAVLGQMNELGSEEVRFHRELGELAASKAVDVLVCIGEGLATSISEGARAAGMDEGRIFSYPDIETAIAALVPELSEDDLVLVKASRSVGLDVFAREVLGL